MVSETFIDVQLLTLAHDNVRIINWRWSTLVNLNDNGRTTMVRLELSALYSDDPEYVTETSETFWCVTHNTNFPWPVVWPGNLWSVIMPAHELEVLRQGLWASLTGGWYYDPHADYFANTFHTYTWLLFLCLPLGIPLVVYAKVQDQLLVFVPSSLIFHSYWIACATTILFKIKFHKESKSYFKNSDSKHADFSTLKFYWLNSRSLKGKKENCTYKTVMKTNFDRMKSN